MSLSPNVTATDLLKALLCLRAPQLEARLQVVYRPSSTGRLYSARRRTSEANVGYAVVVLTWSADLTRPDLQAIIRRAADAALKVARGETNADALFESEENSNA